ncbi:MAG: rhomboid family intramembrane serine protease [Verrucomicrobiales bacterium]|nr:rhomboid family intramembrane serine protease [Verrucomicrobiales bacterium]
MSWFPESKDRLPLTWWKQTPIYLSGAIAIAGVVSLVLTAVLTAISPSLVRALIFEPTTFLQGRLWTLLTYPLVNPPSIWLVIGLLMLWRFGEAVERHLGRWSFVKLLLWLWVMEPLLRLLCHALGLNSGMAAGIQTMEFGVFLAFVALYPRAQLSVLIASVEAWILAAVFVGLAFLSALSNRDVSGMLILAGLVGLPWAYVRYEQGVWKLARPSMKRGPSNAAGRSSSQVGRGWKKETDLQARVDALLEKVSRHGLHSLTEDERRLLERGADDLRRRG